MIISQQSEIETADIFPNSYSSFHEIQFQNPTSIPAQTNDNAEFLIDMTSSVKTSDNKIKVFLVQILL